MSDLEQTTKVQLQAMWVDHLPPATASLLLLRLSELHEVVAVLPFELQQQQQGPQEPMSEMFLHVPESTYS